MDKFKTPSGQPVNLEQELRKYVEKDHTYEITIGTDSQLHRAKNVVVYATVVVIHKIGRGGRFFVRKKHGEVLRSLKERLAREAWESLELAMEVKNVIPENVKLQIHVDSNPSKKFKSGNYTEELVGMITGMGMKCIIKPDAWAAQTIADRFTK